MNKISEYEKEAQRELNYQCSVLKSLMSDKENEYNNALLEILHFPNNFTNGLIDYHELLKMALRLKFKLRK